MPPTFTQLFAETLNSQVKVEVKEAETGDSIVPGRVLIAPGGKHLRVVRTGNQYLVGCRPGGVVNGHCPSVEVLFNSVAQTIGPKAVGVMLTGMGKDGALAMRNMRDAGARTFAQDEESSVVFGMPKAAYECGGAERLVSLSEMTPAVIYALTADR